MINVIKYLGVASMAAGLLAAPLAHAGQAPVFNTYAGDNDFLTGRNVTRNDAAFSQNVTAAGNDEVEVAMYYHNTGGDQATGIGVTAQNVKLKVNMPDAATDVRTHVITGSITADNMGGAITGTRMDNQKLTIDSGSDALKTTMAFVPGSVRWYPERMTQSGAGMTLLNGQDGSTLLTTGLNIGDIKYCWEFSGYIHFKVKLTGERPAILKVQKDVRKAGTSDIFADSVQANPGMKLEYQIKVSEVDGSADAKNVRLQDTLPANETYVGPTVLHKADGSTANLPDGITSAGGIQILDTLKANDTVYVTFTVSTDTSIADAACRVNTVKASSTNAGTVQDTASACFAVPATPTPVPVTPTPKPAPTLPATGPTDSVMPLALLSTSGLGALRYLGLKRKLKKSARGIDIV